MAKVKTRYVCQSCGQSFPKWQGQCSGCEEWNTLAQEVEQPAARRVPNALSGSISIIQTLDEVAIERAARWQTGVDIFDELIGGGLVPGGITLIGGEPGVGKSTFMLQLISRLGVNIKPLAYVSGEESATQIKLRAERLRVGNGSDIILVAEQNLDSALNGLASYLPRMLVVDSIQTVYTPQMDATPGSVTQIRECAAILTKYGKDRGLPVFIVGHVTKEGSIAGPKILEHIVDTVLYFEGDVNSNFRLLRVFKNRYGATGEVAVFQMTDKGLSPVINPSDLFISRKRSDAPGVVVVPLLQGTRCILTEVQALVTQSFLPMPRRVVAGLDSNRLSLVIAVLEKHAGLKFYNRDVFANVAGGLKLTEPGGDLGLAMAMTSSLNDQAMPADVLPIGEVTLAGEIRPVTQIARRIAEGRRFGFKRFVVSGSCDLPEEKGIIKVNSLREAVKSVFA
ncbi:MAG TPA: DNA repair protein RadA [Candidatus Rifleibacterium sp.]|nr:DNA repair protein RadA [Candidatus Rifleibacterium sp.]HPW59107.1 DNA repair protein RadA [Candidatus Rifleibacterium sp.]